MRELVEISPLSADEKFDNGLQSFICWGYGSRGIEKENRGQIALGRLISQNHCPNQVFHYRDGTVPYNLNTEIFLNRPLTKYDFAGVSIEWHVPKPDKGPLFLPLPSLIPTRRATVFFSLTMFTGDTTHIRPILLRQ